MIIGVPVNPDKQSEMNLMHYTPGPGSTIVYCEMCGGGLYLTKSLQERLQEFPKSIIACWVCKADEVHSKKNEVKNFGGEGEFYVTKQGKIVPGGEHQ
ncbi:MAG: hypothetical protein V3V88_02985 [Dehalococcoidia bacterium]